MDLTPFRARPISTSPCRRCGEPAAVRVEHAAFGARVYCLDHFRRLGDVPPGSAVTWA